MSWYFKGILILILGETLKELNKYDEAIQCYDKAISINPKNCGYWDGKGILYIN